MTDKIFDNYIRDKIKDYSSPVPADMWERIQHGKTRRRGIIWWRPLLMTCLGLMAVGIGGLYIMNTSEGDLASYNKNPKTSGPHSQQTPAGDNQSQSAIASIPPESSTPSSNTAASNSTADVSASEPSTTINSTNSKRNIEQPNIAALIPKSSRSGEVNQFKNEASPNLSDFASTTRTDVDEYNGVKYFLRPGLYSFAKQPSLSSLSAPSKKSPFKIDCPRDVEPDAFYVEVFGSPDLVMKKMTSNRGAGDVYVRKKDSSETRQLSFTYGVRFTKALGENFVFKAGLQYSTINEKFSYRTENERKLTTIVTTRTIINSQGQTVVIRDTSSYEQIGYNDRTSYNKFNMIDIPVILGYEWGSEDMSFGLNGGLLLNVTSWQRGETLDANYQPVAFGKNKAMEYKRSVGFGLYAGFSAIKKVAPRTSIFAEPYFRYNLSHFTNDNSLVNEKYHSAGILLGVRYKLTGGKATH